MTSSMSPTASLVRPPSCMRETSSRICLMSNLSPVIEPGIIYSPIQLSHLELALLGLAQLLGFAGGGVSWRTGRGRGWRRLGMEVVVCLDADVEECVTVIVRLALGLALPGLVFPG